MPNYEHPHRRDEPMHEIQLWSRRASRRIAVAIAAAGVLIIAAPADAAPSEPVVEEDNAPLPPPSETPTAVEADDVEDDDGDDADDDEDRDSIQDDDRHTDVDGAEDSHLRIHVDTEAIGGAWSRSDGNGDLSGGDTLSFGAGLARPSLLDDSAVFSRPLVGFGLGWVFAEDRAVFGAKMALTADGYNLDTTSRRAVVVGGRLVPYFHWMFLPGRMVRPYAEGRFGFGGSTSVREGDDELGRRSASIIYPVVGAGLGAHIFPRNYFSIDLGFNVDYAAPYGRTEYRDPDVPDTDWNKAADVVNFGVLLGMSTWF